MNYENIIFERSGRMAIITLNRPEAMNAINAKIWIELSNALEELAHDPELWVGIITGAGDRSFCAGADLKEMSAGTLEPTEEMSKWGFAGIVRHHISKPIIAAVNGFALGGGTEIALSCDLVVSSEKASFGLPEVKLGIVAGAGGLLRLPRQIPLKVAMHAILTGEPISALEAERWGLVNQVVPHDQVLEAAKALAEKIIANDPVAVMTSKEIVYRGLDQSLNFPPDAWKVNEEYIAIMKKSEDDKEGRRAFAKKRQPGWKGK